MPDWIKQWAVTLVVPLVVAAVSYGGLQAQVSQANETAKKAVSREEFMATFGHLEHRLTEIHSDIREIRARQK